jgi:hypothetical protein
LRADARRALTGRARRAAACGVALALALLAAAPAARAGEPVRLHWVRAEGAGTCIDPAALEERVRERLGSDPFDARATRSIEGVVRHAGEGWEAELAVRAHPGDLEPPLRALKSQAKDCESLSEAVVLAVALAIDPAAAFSAAKPAPPAPAPPPPPAPVAVATVSEAPAASAPAGRAELALAGQAGLLPRASLGAALVAAATVSDHLELALRAQIFPAVEVQGAPSYAIGLASGDVRLCARMPRAARVAFVACGGPAVGVMTAALLAGDRAQPGDRAWVAAELGAGAVIGLSRALGLRLGVEGAVPITRYRFVVEGSSDTLFRQSAVALLAHAGLELRFGGPR